MCNRRKLVPIPNFIKQDQRCISQFDPTHPEFGINNKGEECFRIDECIAKTLETLWSAGIKTTGSCCGHGSGSGVIGLVTWYNDKPLEKRSQPYRPLDDVLQRRGPVDPTHKPDH